MKNNDDLENTLCWNCHNAMGGCRWSKVLLPVEGWQVEQTGFDELGPSYSVKACPEFIPDAKQSGNKRLSEKELMQRYTLCEEDKYFRWVRYYKLYA